MEGIPVSFCPECGNMMDEVHVCPEEWEGDVDWDGMDFEDSDAFEDENWEYDW